MTTVWATKTQYLRGTEADNGIVTEYTFIEDNGGEVAAFVSAATTTVDLVSLEFLPVVFEDLSLETRKAIFNLVVNDGTLLDGETVQ
jgi:hypothetical protein